MADIMVNFTPELELIEHLEDLIIIHDLEGRIRYVNRYVQKLLGYSPDDVLNNNILDYLPVRYKKNFFDYLQSIKTEKYHTGVVDVLTEKGQERHLEFRNVVYGRGGKPIGVIGIGRDYTKRERMEKALTEALGRFESIIKHTPLVAVQGFDANGCIYHWNPVSEKLYGMSLKEVLEKPFHKLFLKGIEERRFLNDLKWVFERGLPVENREFAINTENGEKRWVYSSMFPVFEGGNCLEAIRMEMDITERKKAEERLEYLSTHDPLTGIYNRAYFEEEMRRLENPRFRPVSIIVCDVDDLKLINDTFGHGKGDSLLKAVAETIKSPFRSSDVIARIGGDEFVILLPLTSMAVALEACRRINESIEEYNRKNPELPLSVSLGVSTNTDPDTPLIETFKEADSDMYNNKMLK
ncbi:MAG: sensor domain-containing diguanylate cyclase [Dethiobacteria bacterium]